ncbi:MAG: hypothetical protein M1813_005628 [Trichoglossum hirsutum]|nr:MAG: hypothetical protein M1813_005628 [Trichoglossum hirsutum]
MEGREGLQILPPPSDESDTAGAGPTVDVVFIHGLRADPIRNWDKDGFVWIRDALPAALLTARIMTFGYNANVVGDTARGRIRDFALQLLVALKAKRTEDDERKRPLILVGHSLGGLVAKHAMLTANIDREFANLKTCCYGLIFMATPHRGSDKANMGKLLANIAKVSLKRPKNQVLRDLGANSLLLQDLSDDFRHLHSQFRIASFFEQKETVVSMFMPKIMIVNQYSAKMGIEGEMLRPMNADHSSICKFKDANDPLYDSVLSVLKEMIGDAGRFLESRVSANPSSRTSPSQTIFFTVPFEQDPKFIGREDIITEIDRKFKVQRRVTLAGIGGVGKSQIAIEYCYRFRGQHRESHVFWIHATTVSRMDQAYKDIARKLCLPGWNDPNVDTFQLVSKWLSDDTHRPWLLVLDSADDIEVFFNTKSNPSSVGSEQTAPLVNYLPRSSNSSTLITTRDKRVGERLADREKVIMVLPMAEPEAEQLLWSKEAHEGSLDKAKSSKLLEVLGYLPLAITQAAAYISENTITVEEYLEAFCTDDSEMQNLLSEDLPDHRRDRDRDSQNSQNSVIRTWKVSFDQIRKQKPRAAEILALMAVFDRQGIPRTLLRRDGEQRNEFTTALGTLQAFSLVATEKGGASFEIHRLVQVSTQRWLELRGETAKWQEEALKVLTAAFPSGRYGTWVTCETLSPHAQAVARYIFTSDQNLLQRANLLHNMSSYDTEQGRYNLAYERGSGALSTRERVLGPEHLSTLVSMDNIAVVLDNQGKYEAAEEMHRRTLELREKVLGPEHPDTLGSMNNLAMGLNSQGKYEAAEEMHRRTLELREKVLGPEHPSTLVSMNNIAVVLDNQGKYEAAEEMHRQTLELREKVLGPEHPDTLASMNNLAEVLNSQGKYEAAEEMHRRTLELKEKVLGPEHPSTLVSMNNIAVVLDNQGKYEAAEEMHRRTLELREKVLGPEHPSTLVSMNNLAGLLNSQGKYEAAEEMHRRELELCEKVLGPEHPDTLVSMNNLAVGLNSQGKYEAAEEMHRRTLELREKVLGLEHPDTLVGMNNLARVLGNQGKYEAAEEMHRRTLELCEKVLGPEHPHTLASRNSLAGVLRSTA